MFHGQLEMLYALFDFIMQQTVPHKKHWISVILLFPAVNLNIKRRDIRLIHYVLSFFKPYAIR